MPKLFEDVSDDEVCIKTNNEYAKNYDFWRKKEELNKLKTKYGEDANISEESSSSEDDECGEQLTEEVEKDFFKTLSYLKNKDPRIYDNNVNFFNHSKVNSSKKEKKKKDEPIYIKDYERNLILEKGGVLSDDEDNTLQTPSSPTYADEQKTIKEDLKKALETVNDEGDGEWGGIFKKREKSKEEIEKEDAAYWKWLAGEKVKLKDKSVEQDLKPLKEYWGKPDLDDGEKFLKDYILNKKYLDTEDADYIPTYDEIVHSDEDLSNDEDTIEKQEEFEHKYNFRFEEPDPEFIKRYPRTMENSVRKKDGKRSIKRQEIKERKKKEKEEKMQEIKKLQELKKKEIEEKLEKLKEITGNTNVDFVNEDLDGEFSPEDHDRRMQALFNDEFYQGAEDDQKPVFPDLDEELEIENWEHYNGDNEGNTKDEPHCEDPDFNMDCEYDPKAATQKELLDKSRGKKKRKRKSKFAEAVSQSKPKFDPNDKTYEKYFEEYYKLECEDIIDDIPCRFKYRKVIPNDFGLTTEEILFAKERELNKWCSLKKAIQIRADHVEKYDQIAYKKKAQNIELKKKILPSLFVPEEDEKSIEKTNNKEKSVETKTINQSQKVKQKKKNQTDREIQKEDSNRENGVQYVNVTSEKKKRKRKKSQTDSSEEPKKKEKKKHKANDSIPLSDARLSAYGINPKKFKNKLKYKK